MSEEKKYQIVVGTVLSGGEVSYTPAGHPMLKFSVVNNSFRMPGATSDFVKITIFGDKVADIERHLAKFNVVQVTGTLKLEEYTNKKDEEVKQAAITGYENSVLIIKPSSKDNVLEVLYPQQNKILDTPDMEIPPELNF